MSTLAEQAETWWMNLGNKVPTPLSKEWFDMYEDWYETQGFTPNPNCNNCSGTGIFSSVDVGNGITNSESCIFCLEDAIIRGEINGSIDGVNYLNGVKQ